MVRNSFRSFAPVSARGGMTVDASKTAVLCIEFQNEFATKGGKLNAAVASVMQANGMLDKTVDICAAARAVGAKVFHEAITFAEDASDNPNKGLGILAGCAGDKLFTAGTWNADYCDKMKPQEGDIIVDGKKGLDGFPGTNLEELLIANKIETVAITGFLTNCCVESTMRTACKFLSPHSQYNMSSALWLTSLRPVFAALTPYYRFWQTKRASTLLPSRTAAQRIVRRAKMQPSTAPSACSRSHSPQRSSRISYNKYLKQLGTVSDGPT